MSIARVPGDACKNRIKEFMVGTNITPYQIVWYSVFTICAKGSYLGYNNMIDTLGIRSVIATSIVWNANRLYAQSRLPQKIFLAIIIFIIGIYEAQRSKYLY